MLKRPLWVMVGAGLGVGMSVWTRRVARRTVDRFRPGQLSATLVGAANSFSEDLQAAVAEGRQAMRQRELELRRKLAPSPPSRLAIEAKSSDRPLAAGAALTRLPLLKLFFGGR